jgi:hypothetical protein
MELLNPTALYGLLLGPVLLLPYLFRRVPRRQPFSSVLILRELRSSAAGSRRRRLRLPPIFFLQLLALLLLVLAMAEPVFSVLPSRVAVILDNSASMQARSGGRSRFEAAQEEASRLLGWVAARGRVDVFLTSPSLTKVRDSATVTEALAELAGLKPYDTGEASGLEEGIARLQERGAYDRIFLLTDRPVEGASEGIRAVSVGKAENNLAVARLELSRVSLASNATRARVEVRSFSTREERARLVLKAGGRVLGERSLSVAPGESVEASFEELPWSAYYEAELAVEDALALDNRRFAAAPSRQLSILAVSPRPQAVGSLGALPGISVRTVSPSEYETARAGGHAFEIFHYAAPAALPGRPALFILPPRENPLVAVEKVLNRPVISLWKEPHPLTHYVNFSLLRPAYARALKPLSFGETVVETPEGAVAIAFERDGVRYLALGFDPLPYLGAANLPMSVFTLNLLKWLEEAAAPKEIVTGEPLPVRSGAGSVVVWPTGEKFPLERGQERRLAVVQGVYRILGAAQQEFIVANLGDLAESDLLRRVPLRLGGSGASGPAMLSRLGLWTPLLLLVALLLMLEWAVYLRLRPFGARAEGA